MVNFVVVALGLLFVAASLYDHLHNLLLSAHPLLPTPYYTL